MKYTPSILRTNIFKKLFNETKKITVAVYGENEFFFTSKNLIQIDYLRPIIPDKKEVIFSHLTILICALFAKKLFEKVVSLRAFFNTYYA